MNEELNGEMLMLKKLAAAAVLAAVVLGTAPITASADPVQVHGFLLARTIVTQSQYSERIDRYGFQFAQKLDDEFDWVVETYIHSGEADARSRLYLESAYLNWHMGSKLPWDFNVRIGKGRNFTYGITPSYSSRRTTDYSLYSEAFTQVRVTGFQTFSNFADNKVQLAVAVLNPYTWKSRPVPDFPLDPNYTAGNPTGLGFINIPICDRDDDQSYTKRAAVSARLGYKDKIGDIAFNVGADGYATQNGPDKTPGGIKQKNSVNRFGLDAEIKSDMGLMAQAQFTMAQSPYDLDKNAANGTEKLLNHNGGEALVGYEKDKCGLYARYGMLTYDDKLQDLNQVMLSAVYKIRPTVHLRLEGLINGEKENAAKGWKKINNDVLMFETMFAW
jgi:hypothetical protein